MDDSTLINDLHQDKEEGLVAAYVLYQRPLLYFVLRYVQSKEVAEDIVADTFVKAWDTRHRLKQLDGLKAFLYMTAKNACLNYLRRPLVKSEVQPIETIEDVLVEDDDIFVKIVRTELLHEIWQQVAKLSDKQREVFNYTYIDELSAEEIGEKLNMSVTAVYSNRSRALAQLRELLKESAPLWTWVLLNFF